MNTNQQQQAKELYFSTNKTQREIAQAVSVSERTIHRWVKQEEWDRLKKSIHAMPVIILENMHYQLIELQNDIANREEGKRYPTVQEAEITRKLVNCMHKMSHYPCLPQNIQMMQQFSAYVNNEDHDFAVRLVKYANNFFTGKEKYTHKPCHFEYGEKFPTAQGDIAALKQEIEQQQQNNTYPPSPQSSTTQTANCQLPTEDSKEDSVTLSGSRSATQPNESNEDSTNSTANYQLPTEDSKEDSVTLSGSRSATQPNESNENSTNSTANCQLKTKDSANDSPTPTANCPLKTEDSANDSPIPTANCSLKTEDSKEDSVTLNGSRSATQPNESDEDSTTSTANCQLKTEDSAHCPLATADSTEPDISNIKSNETQSHQTTQPTEEHKNPCPQPDKTGHFPPHIADKTKAILPDGSAWVGDDMAFDPHLNIMREITNGEVFWLYKNGYISR